MSDPIVHEIQKYVGFRIKLKTPNDAYTGTVESADEDVVVMTSGGHTPESTAITITIRTTDIEAVMVFANVEAAAERMVA